MPSDLALSLTVISSNFLYSLNIFNIKQKNRLNYPKSAVMGFCSKGLKNEFETAVANEPLAFEPLKVYCISFPPPLVCEVPPYGLKYCLKGPFHLNIHNHKK